MLSQSVGYAATALGVIAAAEGRPLLVKEIAQVGNLPEPYLGKLIHTLARKGILKTQRGIGGGVTLVPPASEISLFDVAQIFEDPVVKQRCMLGNSECSEHRACPCHLFWTVERQKQVEFLQRTTLEDMAQFHRKQKGSHDN